MRFFLTMNRLIAAVDMMTAAPMINVYELEFDSDTLAEPGVFVV